MLVKDPRAFWFHDLWRGATHRHGAELGFLTMLRHPVEVAKSRDTHYTPTDRGEGFRRQRATANIAGWVNACLVTERVTRPDRRVFVRYSDLLGDWRAAIGPVVDRLGSRGGCRPRRPRTRSTTSSTPALRRSESTWDSVDVPDTLRAVAEGVWEQMSRLVDGPRPTPRSSDCLAALRRDYDRLHDHAVGVALDHTQTREVHVRRRTKANVRAALEAEHAEQVAELEAQLEETQGGGFSRFFRRD